MKTTAERQPDPNKRRTGMPGQNSIGQRKSTKEPAAPSADTSPSRANAHANQPQSVPSNERVGEPSGEWREPVTNQDEQRKATNTENNDDAVGEGKA